MVFIGSDLSQGVSPPDVNSDSYPARLMIIWLIIKGSFLLSSLAVSLAAIVKHFLRII